MGYNTVVVVYNDTIAWGDDDPNLGKEIHRASRAWLDRHHNPMGTHMTVRGRGCGSYGVVVSQEHADSTQIVLVGRNNGKRLQDCDTLPSDAAYQMIEALKKAGYTVTKKKAG